MFQRFFNGANPLWTATGRLFDMTVLNVLWLLCCIPIFTIGPSTAAFYYAAMTLVRGEETYVSSDFFRSFRRDFWRNVKVGLLVTLVGVFLAADVYLAYKAGGGIYTFFMVFFFILLLVWAFVALYIFPLLAKFDNSIRNTLIRAFTLSIRHFPQTAIMLFLTVVSCWLCHLAPGLVFVVFGILMEVEATILCAIFKPWLPKPGEGGGQ